MAVHVKLAKLLNAYTPDVVVLSECANQEILGRKLPGKPRWTSMEWVGSYPHKGLAVLTFGNYRVTSRTVGEPALEWVIDVGIAGPTNFTLLAVWAMNHRASTNAAFPLWNPQPAVALDAFRSEQSGPTILAGDFNHNVRWDRPGTPNKNHARTLDAAKRARMTSAYHFMRDEQQGEESTPTLYFHGSPKGRPKLTYHIDYAFIPDEWLERLVGVGIGSPDEWVRSGLSDHVPLIVDIADESAPGAVAAADVALLSSAANRWWDA